MLALIAYSCLVATVTAVDLDVGLGGELIFHKNVTRSPTIWQQVGNITVVSEEPITRIVVIDNREDKNGEVDIVEGGLGFNNVTLEVKSPAVFRGYYFEIQVYAESGNGTQAPVTTDQKKENVVNVQGLNGQQWIVQHPDKTSTDSQTIPHPVQQGKDDNQQQQQQQSHQQQSTTQPPVQQDKDDKQQQQSHQEQSTTQPPVQQGTDDNQQQQQIHHHQQSTTQHPVKLDKNDNQQQQQQSHQQPSTTQPPVQQRTDDNQQQQSYQQ